MAWQDISSAPKDGTVIFASAPDYEWPEIVRWVNYEAELANEIGEAGCWSYVEDILADASPVAENYTHWMRPPAPPISDGRG